MVLPEKGHIHPMLGPAGELASRGWEVAFYASHDIAGTLAAAGFDRFFGGRDAVLPPDASRGRELAALVKDAARLRAWIAAMLVGSVPPQVDALREVVASFAPDVLVIDPMAYHGAIVAELAGLPWVGLSSSLNPVVPDAWDSELIATTRALSADRVALFERYDVKPPPFRVCDALSPWGTAAFTTEAFVEPRAADAGAPVVLAGPSLPARSPTAATRAARPLVLMSLGSQIYFQPRMFATVIAAVRGKPIDLLISAAELAPQLEGLEGKGLPGNVRVERWVAQLDVLERAHVLVTHGGANSVMEALTFGVPMLVTPICNDQPHNARLVVGSRAGVALDLDVATVAQTEATLDLLLASGTERAAAARISASYRARSGSAVAADLVERALA
ncbi:MAG: UDP-glycosyltransferase [Myxococcaceae bacterium]|nr:UDP-glycosyltransferase [Myxococcaceae bacterium]